MSPRLRCRSRRSDASPVLDDKVRLTIDELQKRFGVSRTVIRDTLGEAGRLEEFLAVDVKFHALLLSASGNEMFSALDDVVAEVLRGRTDQGLMPGTPREHALASHEAVAAAIARADPHSAETAMRDLLAEVREAIT